MYINSKIGLAALGKTDGVFKMHFISWVKMYWVSLGAWFLRVGYDIKLSQQVCPSHKAEPSDTACATFGKISQIHFGEIIELILVAEFNFRNRLA